VNPVLLLVHSDAVTAARRRVAIHVLDVLHYVYHLVRHSVKILPDMLV